MSGGYMNRFLWVDLTAGTLREEAPSADLLQAFIGGYGVGARVLYSHVTRHTKPLESGNVLGFLTGPLTGTPAPTGTRWTVVGKSPLTGPWGDANGSGYFGVAFKQAGYDAVFFSGISTQPVYLYTSGTNAARVSAGHGVDAGRGGAKAHGTRSAGLGGRCQGSLG